MELKKAFNAIDHRILFKIIYDMDEREFTLKWIKIYSYN